MSTKSNHPDAQREALEARANLLRARLANTIDVIGDRTRAMVDPRTQIKRNMKAIVVVGAVAGAVVMGSVLSAIVGARRRAKRLPQERVAAVSRWWKHPDRVASTNHGSILGSILRNVIVGAGSYFALQAVKQAGLRALPGASAERTRELEAQA